MQPWSDIRGNNATINYDVQANFFDAYYKVFKDASWWLGYSIFTIDDSHSWYNPYGYPAENVIRGQFEDMSPDNYDGDFNAAIMSGDFQIVKGGNANQPSSNAGILSVTSFNSYTKQVFVDTNASAWVRLYNGKTGVWSSWKSLV